MDIDQVLLAIHNIERKHIERAYLEYNLRVQFITMTYTNFNYDSCNPDHVISIRIFAAR